MKRCLTLALILGLAACESQPSTRSPSPSASGARAAGDARPNIVLFVVDDLGWSDVGTYGSAFHETPNIDRLAKEGMRFAHFYAASPVCSPTRASIMTGKYPARLQLTDFLGNPRDTLSIDTLPRAEFTLGEALGSAGYATGYIGKWHLGADEYGPAEQGFHEVLAVEHDAAPRYFYPYWPRRWWQRNRHGPLGDGEKGEYLTDRLTEEGVRFMERHRDQPFLLVLSHYAVHLPLRGRPDLVAKYEDRARGLPADARVPALVPEGTRGMTRPQQSDPVYAAMVQSVDESVGRLLDALDSLDLAESTVFVFVSDNGGLSTVVRGRALPPTSNAPLRAGKGWLYEGGIRAPMIVRWPGVAERGAVVDAPVSSMDLYPTLLELGRVPPAAERSVDGLSLAPLLRGEAEAIRDTLFWHYPHHHGSGSAPSSAVRIGAHKLIEWLEDGRTELYDLAADPGEASDLSGAMPERAAELRQALHAWRREAGARMP